MKNKETNLTRAVDRLVDHLNDVGIIVPLAIFVIGPIAVISIILGWVLTHVTIVIK